MPGPPSRNPQGLEAAGSKRKASGLAPDDPGRLQTPTQDGASPSLPPRAGTSLSFPTHSNINSPTPRLLTDGSTSPLSGGAKVAIPRLQSRDSGPAKLSGSSDKNRVNHACEPCRQRKTKCSGEQPVCKHCQEFKVQCVYADGKRDRAKKKFEKMEQKIATYEQILGDVSHQLDASTWSRLQSLMARYDDEDIDEEQDSSKDGSFSNTPKTSRGRKKRSQLGDGNPTDPQSKGENVRSASAGSMESLGRITEDVTDSHQAAATGFMGKTSEVDWTRNLRNRIRGDTKSKHPGDGLDDRNPKRATLGSSTHNLDEEDLLDPALVDPHMIPTPNETMVLLEEYFKSVQPQFPFIGKLNFRHQMKNFLGSDSQKPSRPSKKWLAVMNLVFAVAAKHMELIGTAFLADELNHRVFFARARILGLSAHSYFEPPNLQRVQILGMTALYLMTVNQINRAWMFSGLAVRTSIALALHLKLDTESPTGILKELRYRLWWAVYTIDRVLEIMTGRPSPIPYSGFTTPMPVPHDEEELREGKATEQVGSGSGRSLMLRDGNHATLVQNEELPMVISSATRTGKNRPVALKNLPPNLTLFFILRVKQSMLTHHIAETLYRPAGAHDLWSQLQSSISSLNEELDDWLTEVPGRFRFDRPQEDGEFMLERTTLGFFYFNTRLIVNRPCLCDIKPTQIKESPESKDFNRATATRCVSAAMDMLRLLPDRPHVIDIYKYAPWWCLIHHLAQTVTVLNLELFYDCAHMLNKRREVLAAVKKGMRWLHEIGMENKGAARAWALANETLRGIAKNGNLDVSDMPTRWPLQPSSKPLPESVPVNLNYQQAQTPPSMDQPFYGYLYNTYAAPNGFLEPMDIEAMQDGYEQMGDMSMAAGVPMMPTGLNQEIVGGSVQGFTWDPPWELQSTSLDAMEQDEVPNPFPASRRM